MVLIRDISRFWAASDNTAAAADDDVTGVYSSRTRQHGKSNAV
jgi:hypothetical protein